MTVSRMNQLFKYSKIRQRCGLEKNAHAGSAANYDILHIVLLFFAL